MGGSASRDDLINAEHALFERGTKKDFHVHQGTSTKTASAFQAFDVPIPPIALPGLRGDAKLHMHGVAVTTGSDQAAAEAAAARATEPQGGDGSDPVLVVLHGYGSGTGLFYAAMPLLAASWPGRVYALDQLGCGLSSRPNWSSDPNGTENMEAFFAHGLDSWRQAMGVDKMTIVGHSIGSNVAVAYAERHPEHVQQLVLTSVAGMVGQPESFKEQAGEYPWYVRFGVHLWESGWSPFSIVRAVGGSRIISGYAQRRLQPPHDAEEARVELADYIYKNWTYAPISAGGYAHSTLLAPGAFGRKPLVARIPQLKTEKIGFVHGEYDWCDSRHARGMCDREAKRMRRSSSSGKEKLFSVGLVQDAGHNVMISQPRAYVDAILAAIWNTKAWISDYQSLREFSGRRAAAAL